MLQEVHIYNYKSHKETHLGLVSGLNVIVGDTDGGKTAIMDALYWAAFNHPIGEQHRSRWGGDTEVGLVFSDGLDITRLRTDGFNGYVLGEDDKYKAGKGVPDEVTKLLNLPDINWQPQRGEPFLISDSPIDVARKLNEIAKLETIDITLDNLGRQVYNSTIARNKAQSQLAELQESLKQFNDLDQLEKDIVKLEQEDQVLDTLDEDLSTLETLITQATEAKESIAIAEKTLVVEPTVLKLVAIHEEITQLVAERGNLKALAAEAVEAQQSIDQADKVLQAEPKIKELLALQVEIQEMETDCDKLVDILEDHTHANNNVMNATLQLEELQAAYNKAMPDVCPLCKGKVKK